MKKLSYLVLEKIYFSAIDYSIFYCNWSIGSSLPLGAKRRLRNYILALTHDIEIVVPNRCLCIEIHLFSL